MDQSRGRGDLDNVRWQVLIKQTSGSKGGGVTVTTPCYGTSQRHGLRVTETRSWRRQNGRPGVDDAAHHGRVWIMTRESEAVCRTPSALQGRCHLSWLVAFNRTVHRSQQREEGLTGPHPHPPRSYKPLMVTGGRKVTFFSGVDSGRLSLLN